MNKHEDGDGVDKKGTSGKLELLDNRKEDLFKVVYEMQALLNVCEQAAYSQVEVSEGEKWDGVFGIMSRLVKTAEESLNEVEEIICEMKRSAYERN